MHSIFETMLEILSRMSFGMLFGIVAFSGILSSPIQADDYEAAVGSVGFYTSQDSSIPETTSVRPPSHLKLYGYEQDRLNCLPKGMGPGIYWAMRVDRTDSENFKIWQVQIHVAISAIDESARINYIQIFKGLLRPEPEVKEWDGATAVAINDENERTAGYERIDRYALNLSPLELEAEFILDEINCDELSQTISWDVGSWDQRSTNNITASIGQNIKIYYSDDIIRMTGGFTFYDSYFSVLSQYGREQNVSFQFYPLRGAKFTRSQLLLDK